MTPVCFSYLNEIPNDKGNLIKGLQRINHTEGYLSEEALKVCSVYFGVAEAEVEGVVSFYTQFKRTKPGKYKISVCDCTACHIKGSPLIMEWISNELGIKNGETSMCGTFSLETVACLGCCSLAPVMSINGEVFGSLDRKSTLRIVKEFQKKGAL